MQPERKRSALRFSLSTGLVLVAIVSCAAWALSSPRLQAANASTVETTTDADTGQLKADDPSSGKLDSSANTEKSTKADTEQSELAADTDLTYVMTGSLVAAESEILTVPLTSNWQLGLKWLIAEGEPVAAGTTIALLDPAGITAQLESSEDELLTKRQERASAESEASVNRINLELTLKRTDVEYRKAMLDADVPQDVLKGEDFRERQFKLATSRKALEDAQLELLNHDTSTRSRLGEIDVEIEELRSKVRQMQRQLESLELKASQSGIVLHARRMQGDRNVRVGDQLNATDRVASIPNLSTLQVEAWAADFEVMRLKEGSPARLFLDAYPEQPFTGQVIAIAAAGEKRSSWGRSNYVRVHLSLDQANLSIMKPGMSVRCEVQPSPPTLIAEGASR